MININDENNKYDDKFILTRLVEGKTRKEIANELNHKSYKTIDMYMRRRGYVWNSEKQIYTKKLNKPNNYDDINSSKASRIISLFNKGIEPMEIAKKVGLKDHRTMAIYMKNKGYLWSTDVNNYVLKKGIQDFDDASLDHIDSDNNSIPTETNFNEDDVSFQGISQLTDLQKIQKLIPLLEIINKNKDKLVEMLAINDNSTIPRYVVGGVTITKSLCMSHSLSELVKEFSAEKNISQREIFEVAIIEFLKKYGYEDEVNALFL